MVIGKYPCHQRGEFQVPAIVTATMFRNLKSKAHTKIISLLVYFDPEFAWKRAATSGEFLKQDTKRKAAHARPAADCWLRRLATFSMRSAVVASTSTKADSAARLR